MRSRGERGGVAILIAVTIPTIVAIGAGLILIGNITILRQQLQYAADASAADGALIAKRQGLASSSLPNYRDTYSFLPSTASAQSTSNTLQTARDHNLLLPGTAVLPTWALNPPLVQATPPPLPSPPLEQLVDYVYSKSTLQTTYAGVQINASATYKMSQIRTGVPRNRPPGVVLVLDYSYSMTKVAADGHSAIQDLKDAVQQFTQNFKPGDVNLGLVIYDSGVDATVEPGVTAADYANVYSVAAGYSPHGDTDTATAIDKATAMLTGLTENFGRNIILISDGEPCTAAAGSPAGGPCTNEPAISNAIASAQAARGGSNDVQIFTLYVNTGGQDATNTLSQIASAGCAFTSSPADVTTVLSQFNVQPLCDIMPGGNPNDSYAFVRNEASGSEQPLRNYATASQMSCPDNCGTYGFVAQTTPYNLIILSSQACTDILTPGSNKDAVVRWGMPILAL